MLRALPWSGAVHTAGAVRDAMAADSGEAAGDMCAGGGARSAHITTHLKLAPPWPTVVHTNRGAVVMLEASAQQALD